MATPDTFKALRLEILKTISFVVIHVAFISILGLSTEFTSVLADENVAPIVIKPPIPLDPTTNETRPIIGFRKASTSLFEEKIVGVPIGKNWPTVFVPERVLISSWFTDRDFYEIANKAGIPQELATIANLKAAGINIEKFKWKIPGNQVSSIRGKELTLSGFPKNEKLHFDATGIIAMTAAKTLDLSKTYPSSMADVTEQYVALIPRYAEAIKLTHFAAAGFKDYSISDPNINWELSKSELMEASTKYPFGFEKSMSINLGNATFGKLLIKTAREAGFTVESSIKRDYDVYFVEFAMTFYDLPLEVIEEIAFRVKCSQNCIAWELAPHIITNEEMLTTMIKTPEISFKGISLGTFFSREIISYKLKPQIISYGLRENSFSWALKNEAIVPGSHRFLAAIGFPKGSTNARFSRSVGIRTNKEVLIEGSWADTETVYNNIALQ